MLPGVPATGRPPLATQSDGWAIHSVAFPEPYHVPGPEEPVRILRESEAGPGQGGILRGHSAGRTGMGRSLGVVAAQSGCQGQIWYSGKASWQRWCLSRSLKGEELAGMRGRRTFHVGGPEPGPPCCIQVSPCPRRGQALSRCRLWGGCYTWDRPSRPRREHTPASAATWQEIAARTSSWRCMVSTAGVT